MNCWCYCPWGATSQEGSIELSSKIDLSQCVYLNSYKIMTYNQNNQCFLTDSSQLLFLNTLVQHYLTTPNSHHQLNQVFVLVHRFVS